MSNADESRHSPVKKPRQIFPYRKQFTMPKRLPSTNFDLLHPHPKDDSDDGISQNLSDDDFTEEEAKILQGAA